jgi:catechol 2,3-dioxygenase-like lactoylglutathione lyase family enzyme
MKTLRLDHVTIVTPDAAKAAATFRDYFSLGPARSEAAEAAGPQGRAALAIGGARIEFVTPAAGSGLAAALAASGEGMAALCLEVADLQAASAALQRAGVRFATAESGGRRRLEVDSAAAHGVRLTLVAPA